MVFCTFCAMHKTMADLVVYGQSAKILVSIKFFIPTDLGTVIAQYTQ